MGLHLALSANMKTVIIISKCTRVIKINSTENLFYFHFKGVCAGQVLRHVILKGAPNLKLKKNDECLLYVKLVSCNEGTLQGEILKVKNLNACWDLS